MLALLTILSLAACTYAGYERGHWAGRQAERRAHQCADELAMVAAARGRHPAGRDQ
jgi:hypothetical protein